MGKNGAEGWAAKALVLNPVLQLVYGVILFPSLSFNPSEQSVSVKMTWNASSLSFHSIPEGSDILSPKNQYLTYQPSL